MQIHLTTNHQITFNIPITYPIIVKCTPARGQTKEGGFSYGGNVATWKEKIYRALHSQVFLDREVHFTRKIGAINKCRSFTRTAKKRFLFRATTALLVPGRFWNEEKEELVYSSVTDFLRKKRETQSCLRAKGCLQTLKDSRTSSWLD